MALQPREPQHLTIPRNDMAQVEYQRHVKDKLHEMLWLGWEIVNNVEVKAQANTEFVAICFYKDCTLPKGVVEVEVPKGPVPPLSGQF